MARTTIDGVSLTPKQARVVELLGQGKTVPQVARSMKIKNSGVYGHIRRLRAAGVTLPGEHANGRAPANSSGTRVASGAFTSGGDFTLSTGNGHGASKEDVLDLIDRAQHEALERVKACRELLANVAEEREKLIARQDEVTAALGAAEQEADSYARARSDIEEPVPV